MFDQSNFFSRYEIKTNEPTKQRKTCFKTGAYFVSQLLRTQDPSCLVVCYVTLSRSLRIVKSSLSSPFVQNSVPYICHDFFSFEAKENHFNSSFLNGKSNTKFV